MKNLCRQGRIYKLIKRYVIIQFKRFYSEYIVNGRENVPSDGPVIYAANHVNALMDPLAVISILPKNTQIIYLARSDYFKNKFIRKWLLFFKILPAFRMREGIGNLTRNQFVFDKCIDVLKSHNSLGVMPEGSQGFTRNIRPLKKGIFRIAFKAQEAIGNQTSVKIVPIGIDYGSWEKFGEHIIINIGKPLEIANYMIAYQKDPIAGINQLRNQLSLNLKELTFDLATKKHYDCFETVTKAVEHKMTKHQFGKPDNTYFRFISRQKIAQKLIALEQKMPFLVDKIESISSQYKKNMIELKLEPWVLDYRFNEKKHLVWTCLLLLLTSPIFILGYLINFIPFFAPDFILRILKINLPGGLSSLRFGIGILTFPILYVLQGIFIYRKLKGEFWHLLILIPLQYFLGKLSFYWYKNFQKWLLLIHYRKLKRIKPTETHALESLHNQLYEIIQTN